MVIGIKCVLTQAPVLSRGNPLPQMCSAPSCGRAMHGELCMGTSILLERCCHLYLCSVCPTSDTINIFYQGEKCHKSQKQLIPEGRTWWRWRDLPFSLGLSKCLPTLLCQECRPPDCSVMATRAVSESIFTCQNTIPASFG